MKIFPAPPPKARANTTGGLELSRGLRLAESGYKRLFLSAEQLAYWDNDASVWGTKVLSATGLFDVYIPFRKGAPTTGMDYAVGKIIVPIPVHPEHIDGAGQPLINVYLIWHAAAAGPGNVYWHFEYQKRNEDDDMEANVTTGLSSIADAVSGTVQGRVTTQMGSIANADAGDLILFHVDRMGADVLDTHGGEARLDGILFYYLGLWR